MAAYKNAEPRHVVLTDEGKDFFARAVARCSASEIILTRERDRAFDTGRATSDAGALLLDAADR